ncbi:tenascin isoform X5 [Drosophila albomicans]|uniref:Tenascin isoform X5 n=1 Tax=Drosophila albomicans TaxID=7291 RepID=A0A9C6WIU7_DROAB|nr:tenascin isoform X5 [Drosophila albomicans]
MTPQHIWIIYYYAFHLFLVLCRAPPLLTLKTEAVNLKVCGEGVVSPDPDDCASYFQCLDGAIIKEKCSSGSYFDSSWDVCVIDVDGICTPATVNCTEGELEVNPFNSCGYLKCLNGSITEVNCTSGNYFNSTLMTCTIDENGICSAIDDECIEGEIEENPEDPCGYFECINGSFEDVDCTSGTYFNSSLNICLIDENGICSAIDEKCIEGEIEENPDDPCGYLQCVDGSLEEVNCTSGTYFNSSLNICLIDENGICSLKCTEGEIEENPDDPCGYLRCINGNLEELNCTSGSYFNSSIKVCLIDENGICSAIPEDCRDGDIEENPDDLCGYLICKDGSFSEANCTSGSYFDSSWKTCIIDENGICSSRNLVEACIEDEIESDPEECAGYLQCIDGKRVSQLCAYGSYFDSALKSCEIDYDNVCLSKSEICEEGERKEDLDDTTWYFECINGIMLSKNAKRKVTLRAV